MAMSLADYAATTKDDLQAGVINAILDDGADGGSGGGGNILRAMPVGTMSGLTASFLKVNSEGSSAGVGTRAIGGAYPEGSVSLYRESVTAANYGGRIIIDEAFELGGNYVEGAEPSVIQVQQKAKLLNRLVNNDIVNGDKGVTPNGLIGWKKWVTSKQTYLVTDFNSSYTNGLTVSTSNTTRQDFLDILDRFLSFVGGPDNPDVKLVANWYVKKRISESVRRLNQFAITKDQYGRVVTSYQGVEILDPGAKTAVTNLRDAITNANMVIPNNFSFGTDNTCTQIWAVRMGVDRGVALYNVRPLTTTVIPRLEAAPAKAIELGWYPVQYPKVEDCIAVLNGVDVVS